jgi:hypothetical protein
MYTRSSRMHPGLDFIKEYDPTCHDDGSCEMDVHANTTMHGVVVALYPGDASPNVVILLDNGMYIIYGHVDALVSVGQDVNLGDLIGRLHDQRNTLRADGTTYDNTHLHLAVRVGDRTFNPVYFFKQEDISDIVWQPYAEGENLYSVSSYLYSTTSYWRYPSSPDISATRY